jgi:hypothetical protein
MAPEFLPRLLLGGLTAIIVGTKWSTLQIQSIVRLVAGLVWVLYAFSISDPQHVVNSIAAAGLWCCAWGLKGLIEVRRETHR